MLKNLCEAWLRLQGFHVGLLVDLLAEATTGLLVCQRPSAKVVLQLALKAVRALEPTDLLRRVLVDRRGVSPGPEQPDHLLNLNQLPFCFELAVTYPPNKLDGFDLAKQAPLRH